jgi:hypothetical protein
VVAVTRSNSALDFPGSLLSPSLPVLPASTKRILRRARFSVIQAAKPYYIFKKLSKKEGDEKCESLF